MPTPAAQPHTVEGLLRVEARDSELALLKLMVDKLKLQLLRRVRAAFGTSSEQLAAQAMLIDGAGAPSRGPGCPSRQCRSALWLRVLRWPRRPLLGNNLGRAFTTSQGSPRF